MTNENLEMHFALCIPHKKRDRSEGPVSGKTNLFDAD
jgi:hypothetical protein